jgi:hypothetical protein
LSRSVLAAGMQGVRQSLEILGSAGVGGAAGRTLAPGWQWRGDRMLLSVDLASVKFVAGTTLYQEDQESFLLSEFVGSGETIARQAPWLRGLSRYEIPFCMGLAGGLASAWPDTTSTCALLERFSNFYRNHRTQLESAARELRYILEGIFALQHWPALFEDLMQSIGPGARASLPRGLAEADVGTFLGRVLADRSIALRGLPLSVSMEVPHYRRAIERLGTSAERVAPIVERLRDAL